VAPIHTGSAVTVLGPVEPGTLGQTLVREHLAASFAPPSDTPAGWRAAGRKRPAAAADRRFYETPLGIGMLGAAALGAANRDNESLGDMGVAEAELLGFTRAGGRSIVDATTRSHRRNASALAQLARSTGVNIVMAAGWHHPDWSPEIHGRSAGSLAAEIMRELSDGVDGVQAGLIGPLGPLDPAVPEERVLLLAAAAAACETGAPLVLDRSADPAKRNAALKLLVAEGVPPWRIGLGRCGGLALDINDAEQVLAYGVCLQFDELGRIPSVQTRTADHDVAAAILELARRGYAERLLVSHSISRKTGLKAYGGNGYGFLLEQFTGYLAGLGAGEAELRLLTTGNPQRFLTFTSQEPA